MFLKGPEQSLLLYSTKEWEKVLERTQTSLDEDQSRLFMHFVVSEAGSSDIDKTGRILIPGRLRKLVPVDEDQEVILVGLYHRMEIWNQATGVGISLARKTGMSKIWQRSRTSLVWPHAIKSTSP